MTCLVPRVCLQPTIQVSAKDAPSHRTLKFRQDGQATSADLDKRDLRAELEDRERKARRKDDLTNFEEERQKDLLLLQQEPAAAPSRALVPKAVDADEEDPDSEDADSGDDDEDDEAELMAELERIKKERAEEAAKKAKEEAVVQAKEKEKELATGNPLLALGADASFSIKRRWDDDVVFKNQSRGEPKAQKRFINDTIRNDFHRKFLTRYIR